MRLYAFMQSVAWPRSYLGKILLLCFLGTHVPLIALALWALARTGFAASAGELLVVLVATLLGTAFTFAAMSSMLKPVLRSIDALDLYARTGEKPHLPNAYGDEAGRLMASVQNALLQLDGKLDELTLISITDPLTGARNRRWLNDVGIADFEHARRKGRLYSLLVIDLDEFKQLNDNWGHSVGDQVLITVADAIAAAVRDDDSTVRTGGDEFCVFLPGADASTAAGIAERVRAEIFRNVAELPDHHQITVSIGAATSQRTDQGFTDLYLRADRNLYRAKEEGRDRVAT